MSMTFMFSVALHFEISSAPPKRGKMGGKAKVKAGGLAFSRALGVRCTPNPLHRKLFADIFAHGAATHGSGV
jgi:hypothetical protein